MLLFGLSALLLAQLSQSYPYPQYNSKKYTRSPYQPTYIPVPVPYSFSQDNLDEINAPNVRYYYYPVRTEPHYGYYNDPLSESGISINSEEYPIGQEMWYENGEDYDAARAAATAEADANFLRNLIITQMYQDAAASAAVGAGHSSRYAYPYITKPSQDYDEKNWLFGVPTTDADDKEKLQELTRKYEDEEVRELETLRKQPSKEGKRRRKQKAKENKENNREKKDYSEVSLVTSKPIKSEGSSISDRKNKLVGQKEIVLPQPARPARKQFAELPERPHTRSEDPSPYETIKQLLAMENERRKTDDSRLKKRFVSTEEQLTQQLSSLKKSSL